MNNSFYENLQNITNHLNNIDMFELTEKRQNVEFNIKQLPTELITYIFSYLSLMPFDKDDFKTYYDKNKLLYKTYNTIDNHFSFNGENNTPYNYNRSYLLGYTKENKRYYDAPNLYGCELRLLDDIYRFECDIYFSYNKGRTNRHHTINIKRFLSKRNDAYDYKTEILEYIDNNISKTDIKILSPFTNYKRLTKAELHNMIIKYIMNFY